MTVDGEKNKLTRKQQVFIDEYLKCFNASEAARRAGYSEKTAYSIGQENLNKPELKAIIDARLAEIHMSADEALQIMEQQARADIGTFFRLVEEWTFFPLPTYDILGAKEVVDDADEKNPKTRISYFCRHVVLDTDKLVDPQYSHLLREFSDSPKNGLSIKLHDKQHAARDILKMHGKFTDKLDITSGGEKLEVVFREVLNDQNTDH